MQCNSKLCYIFIFLRQYSKIIYFISEIVTVTGLLGLYYVTMSSINKTNCGRRKGLTEPRRKVKCPVSECEYTGRIDNTKAHLRSLIVWSNRYEGEAAEQDETSYSIASKESKKHTLWFRRYGFTKTKWPQFQSDSEMQFKRISAFFGNSISNNNNQRGDEATPVLTPENPLCVCATTDHECQICREKVCNFCSVGKEDDEKKRFHRRCLQRKENLSTNAPISISSEIYPWTQYRI